MPVYEFKCQRCGRKSEILCSMGEKGENLCCEHCGVRGIERVMSGFCRRNTGRDEAGQSSTSSCTGCSTHNCGTCGR